MAGEACRITPGEPPSPVHARDLDQQVFDTPHPPAARPAWPDTAERPAFPEPIDEKERS